jgi:GT2 family glycosyltransferase
LHGQQQAAALQAEVERRTEWAREQHQALLQEQKNRDRWVHSLEQALKTEQEQRDRWVRSLEQEIQSGIEAVKREQEAHAQTQEMYQDLRAVHETVLHSSSWRITRPLRASRRVLTNLAQARAWNPARWPLLLSQAVRTLSTQGLHGALLRLQQSPQHALPADAAASQFQTTGPVGDAQAPPVMPRADRPAVSIIIPVYNQWQYTAACLRSIAQARNTAGFEVIVVDDHSQDQTPQQLAGIAGLEFLCNPRNIGFVGSCNRGVEAASGEYIVLLNNDTQVPDGWLDALLETFQRFPNTGLAGARLVYPDGRLQEAGGIVFRDGSGWNYGRGDHAERPEYAFSREVDYCSGACIMLPAGLFRQLGGLDQHYAPAYYEDTDLAFRVRQAGFKVRLQAAATVIHHEGMTSGTDPASGAKRYQEINRHKFLERWQDQLAAYPERIADVNDQAAIRRARDHRLRGRVLVIDAYTPEPDQDSGSLRLRYLFDCFQQLGYGVSFFADNRGHAGIYSSELQKAGVEVLYNPWIASLQDFFRERGGDFDFIMISRHYVAVNYLALIQRYCPRARFIFDTVDLHYLREQRLAELEGSLPLKRVAAQTKRSELAVIRQAAATLVVSPVEQAVLAQDAPQAHVHVLSNIHRLCADCKGYAARKDIFFVGGYQHPPNIDAAMWFVNSIWPLIREQLPDIRFHLIGSKAPEKVRALHGNGVEFHGYVKDLQPWLDGCRLAVAPLRYGAGVKGKVNLSMSHGQPVVVTPMAVEGLYARDGEDVLVAESAQDFAAAVVRLYRDEPLWNRLAAAGLENVRQHFSMDCARDSLRNILDSLHQA